MKKFATALVCALLFASKSFAGIVVTTDVTVDNTPVNTANVTIQFFAGADSGTQDVTAFGVDAVIAGLLNPIQSPSLTYATTGQWSTFPVSNRTSSISGNNISIAAFNEFGASIPGEFNPRNISIGAPSILATLTFTVDKHPALNQDMTVTPSAGAASVAISPFASAPIGSGFFATTGSAPGSPTAVNSQDYQQGFGRITAIPEPSSLALLGIGAVGLLYRRRS